MSSTLGVRDGDLTYAVIDGVEAIRQQVRQALLLWLGEWFRDVSRGNNLRSLLGRNDSDSLAEEVEATVLSVDAVTAVRIVSLSADGRKLSGILVVTTDAGDTVEVAV